MWQSKFITVVLTCLAILIQTGCIGDEPWLPPMRFRSPQALYNYTVGDISPKDREDCVYIMTRWVSDPEKSNRLAAKAYVLDFVQRIRRGEQNWTPWHLEILKLNIAGDATQHVDGDRLDEVRELAAKLGEPSMLDPSTTRPRK